jgi:hypothetical protein
MSIAAPFVMLFVGRDVFLVSLWVLSELLGLHGRLQAQN